MFDVLDGSDRRGAEEQAKLAAINLYKMGLKPEDIAKVQVKVFQHRNAA